MILNTHASLFSGIGGFDLAAEWMGWDNLFHCEWNEFGQRVLKYYWPQAESYGDITKTAFSIWRGRINVLTGGFPCQPYSVAGKRLGKEDERHLWPEMLRAIREIQPIYVVGENVPGLLNWNGGLVFNEVQADLEAEGYEVQPVILPACGVNAPHKRERVWFVAHSTSNRREWTGKGIGIEKRLQQRPEPSGELAGRFERLCFQGNATNTECKGFQKPKQGEQYEQLLDAERDNTQNDTSNAFDTGLQGGKRSGTHGKQHRAKAYRPVTEQVKIPTWDKWPTQSPVCSRDDGISTRLDGITFPKWRNESIKAYGNAIVPQVAYQIFKAIEKHAASVGRV